MARCPDCNKFVGVELLEPEVESFEIDSSTMEFSASVRVIKGCADCGTELQDTIIDVYESIDGHEDCLEKLDESDDELFDIVTELEDNIEPAEKVDEKVKNPRYQKRFYGFSGTVKLKCKVCGEEMEYGIEDYEQASNFNDLNY